MEYITCKIKKDTLSSEISTKGRSQLKPILITGINERTAQKDANNRNIWEFYFIVVFEEVVSLEDIKIK